MRIFWFCIPAHGHTNPSIEVVRELVRRGHDVRYYSFEDFRAKIEETGADFVPCDRFLTPIDAKTEKRLRKVSTTEMSIRSFETTASMDATIARDVETLRPDLVVSDSACFWGKLTAIKYGLPMVCSTTTFAFNEQSSQYMKLSAAELADMILGLPRLTHAMKKLRPLGYRVKSPLDIVRSKPDEDTIVYTSRGFQPCAESFDSAHYRFVGPSLRPVEPREKTGRPLVYVSLGTVINDHPDFYRNCIEALRGQDVDLLISCGTAFDPAQLDPLPENAQVAQSVDQLDVLSRTGLFITHCGMNSASEGLVLAVPELLFPLTSEQWAVARRVAETGAGRLLSKETAASPEALRAAILDALADETLREAAARMREDLRSCGGAKAAADFIEEVAAKAAKA